MNAPTTTFRSILEKPLNQLTEDDISQLTREDCRKYLKEKGMRRPSWNKSQAIQQVISLKALLEPNDDSGAGALRKIVVLPQTTTATTQRVSTFAASSSADSAKEASPDVQASVSADELAPHPRNEPSKPAPEDPPVYADTISPRNHCTTDASVRKMTIFYSGKVNVYDGVPPDKGYMDLQARAILHLAAGPNHLLLDNQFGGAAAARSLHCQFQNAGDKDVLSLPSATISQAMQTVSCNFAEKIGECTQQYWEKVNNTRDPEGQANRKVSLQRYLEKRKDRTHTSNGNSSQYGTSSPPQPGLLQTAENQPKFRCLPVDLNEKGRLDAEFCYVMVFEGLKSETDDVM
ncbi:protein TIFY 4B isoform X12 [Pyrus x bretschneideri]|uniref:protein TIFY 4B isoform X12 n=1 Tax=Pyrus x bretschneideri TaxID=225117 RepID=UPI00202DD93F|nr:protein TIFY 4B isoform X12 [Pyrus x bretschneideri]